MAAAAAPKRQQQSRSSPAAAAAAAEVWRRAARRPRLAHLTRSCSAHSSHPRTPVQVFKPTLASLLSLDSVRSCSGLSSLRACTQIPSFHCHPPQTPLSSSSSPVTAGGPTPALVQRRRSAPRHAPPSATPGCTSHQSPNHLSSCNNYSNTSGRQVSSVVMRVGLGQQAGTAPGGKSARAGLPAGRGGRQGPVLAGQGRTAPKNSCGGGCRRCGCCWCRLGGAVAEP